jgi:uncharacterized membrane protein
MLDKESIIERKFMLFTLIFLIPFITLIVGYLFAPSIFYDQFIWKYFWGPIVADALNQPMSFNGVAAAQKFTIVSEIVYGVIVVFVLYSLLWILKRWDIKIDTAFFIALLPYVIYGSIVRVLEDAQFFSEPFVYWFVTPLIYFQTIFWALLFLSFGVFLHKKINDKWFSTHHVFFLGGLFLLTPFLFFTSLWFLGEQWSYSNGVRFDIILLISCILFIVLLGVYCIGKYWKKYPWLIVYTGFLNLSMIMGHMLDGITSWISIYDPFHMNLPNYVEKHPASDFLMQIWPPLFPIVKFFLILLIIYLFDVVYKKDLEKYPRFAPLLKIGIFVLGFAPGLRDLLRVSMGV